MALAQVRSRTQSGLDAEAVEVEVHLANGLPALNIVGLPEAAVREAKDRIRAAITQSGYGFPQRRITINLAPADLPKQGGRFDLAMALGILLAQGDLPAGCLDGIEVLGELSLAGAVRPVPGALPAALHATRAGHALLLPADNLAEASLCGHARLHAAHHLGALCAALHTGALPPVMVATTATPTASLPPAGSSPDLADVRGQTQAKRALEIAAAGGHSLLMVGPPGSGKSMLAARLPGLLPPLSADEALEVACIRSISPEGFDPAQWGTRPYRSPHHTASGIALVGGGSHPKPGEITLAHHGVLFLDELPEFPRSVLDVLRQPLESGEVHIARATQQARFPARFQLIAAMNPCPCGHAGDPQVSCRCTPDAISRYQSRISGPLLDRIDLQVPVPRVAQDELLPPVRSNQAPATDSATVRTRVLAARTRQLARQGRPNAALTVSALDQHALLSPEGRQLLVQAAERLSLSARGLHRVIKVARTIADLGDTAQIETSALAEALRYRSGFSR